MDIKTLQTMITTRLKAAKKSGNSTEASLMFELLKMSEELAKLKKEKENENDI